MVNLNILLQFDEDDILLNKDKRRNLNSWEEEIQNNIFLKSHALLVKFRNTRQKLCSQ